MNNNTEKLWSAVEIEADALAVGAVEFALNEAGADGIELNLLGKPQNAETVAVIGYFQTKPEEETLQAWIVEGLQIYGFDESALKSVVWREVENTDWLAEWKKNWHPITVGNIVVAPSWSEITENERQIVLRIEPGMAFGTGTHETTKLCLQAIQENFDGGSFLDVGTGTGILAIAVSKLKLQNDALKSGEIIVGCDVDFDSVTIARENAGINAVADVEFYVGSIMESSPEFNFVCANLTADVIIPLLPLLVAKSKKTLVLSGILAEQKEWVCNELSEKFQIPQTALKIESDGIWISILWRR